MKKKEEKEENERKMKKKRRKKGIRKERKLKERITPPNLPTAHPPCITTKTPKPSKNSKKHQNPP